MRHIIALVIIVLIMLAMVVMAKTIIAAHKRLVTQCVMYE